MTNPSLSINRSPIRDGLFRFFFIYFILYAAPWTWLDNIGFIGSVTKYYYQLTDWLVNWANSKIFRQWDELVPLNGSGDTSWAWTQLWFYLLISLFFALVWTILSKKGTTQQQRYFLYTALRYFIAIQAFTYGIIKLFALQMPFPNLSQMATPLGEFLPMRFSWMFIGYSEPYQIFSGVMEVVAGSLLFFRRTTTAGVLISCSVFINVMVLNYCYDIPVKLFSTHLVAMTVFLILMDYKRMLAFFVRNQIAEATALYEIAIEKKWQKIARIILKISFVVFVIIIPFNNAKNRHEAGKKVKPSYPIHTGYYDVLSFAINGDTLVSKTGDSTRWENVVFDLYGQGSLISSDTAFKKRYGRSYFNYKVDTTLKQIKFTKLFNQADPGFLMNYLIEDSNTIRLWGKRRNDSLFVLLRRNNKEYQLSEKQFHWLSEYNR